MTHIKNILAGASSVHAAILRSTDDALLSELGLTDDAAGAETAAEPDAAGDEAEAATKTARTEIKVVGSIATGKRKGLPALVRNGFAGGKRGSKYPFESLVAPIGPDADGDYEYDFFTVNLTDVENADAKKLQGAIQAATAAQNKQAKAEGNGVYYVSRTETGENGEYIGSTVYRVDQTISE